MKDDYIEAVIKVKVPKWQIGEEVSVYFPDTMCVKGTCEERCSKTYYSTDGGETLKLVKLNKTEEGWVYEEV